MPSVALVGLAAALWGTGGAAAKQLLLVFPADPIEVGFYRLAISAPAFLVAGLLFRKRHLLWRVAPSAHLADRGSGPCRRRSASCFSTTSSPGRASPLPR